MDPTIIETLIQRSYDEDLPDITSEAIFDPEERATARVIVKEDGVIAALDTIEIALRKLDSDAKVELLASDGDRVTSGTVVASATALVRALLGAERTILNILQHASGVASLTRRFVDAVEDTGVDIVDTRKTVPGLRSLDKAAVVLGGGQNHRMGLHDMFLIKDNHIDRAGGIRNAVQRVKRSGLDRPMMIEVRDLDEFEIALDSEPEYILLDNMAPEMMEEAVRRRNSRTGPPVYLEASGGVTLGTVRRIAETRVDRISIGALTHSASALDISMKVEIDQPVS